LIPKKWHLYIVDLEPRIGTKPIKKQPCLVIQPTEFSEAGLNSTVILPITTKLVKGDAFPLRIKIPQGIAGLTKPSEVIIDQILAWDNSLFRQELGVLPESLIEEVKIALKDFLDLDN
jgi:mRNA interferase MazF